MPIAAPIDRTEEWIDARLRGWGPAGVLAMAAILLIAAVSTVLGTIMVLVWARISGTPWREIGYVRPASWIGRAAMGVGLGIVLKFAMKALIMPLLGADPVNQAFHYLARNPVAIPETLFLLTVGAGLGEETIFRGYMFERLGKLVGRGRGATIFIVMFTSTLFGLAHYTTQGWTGVEQAVLTGLTFATIFAMTGELWMLMCAHAAFDLTAYALIYWDLETPVAHFIFR